MTTVLGSITETLGVNGSESNRSLVEKPRCGRSRYFDLTSKRRKTISNPVGGCYSDAQAVTLLILLTLTKDESTSKKKEYNIKPRWTALQ